MYTDKMYMQDYFYEGNNGKLVFFIHGIYSCPAMFEMFYPILKERGFSIYAILLEGHGNELRKLAKVKYKDWDKQINDMLKDLSKKYEKVYVVGHSMGGLLALDTKEEYIYKRILIAPALRVKVSWRYIRLGIVMNNLKVKDEYTNSNRKLIGVFFPKRIFKRLLTVLCFWQLFKLIYYTDINLKNIKKPIMIVQSYNDECVTPRGPKRIINNIGSKEKKLIWLKKSYHGVFEPNEEGLMVNKVMSFIEDNENEK